MDLDRTTPPAEPQGSAQRTALAAVNLVDQVITVFCRYVVLLTGIALTMILTANVFARYAFSAGGLDVAQELPERLFPWFIVAGIVLAAQAGGHVAVEWLIGRVGPHGGRWVILAGNVIVIVSYAFLFRQALLLAEIAKIERSPVLQLSGSHGYWAMAMAFALVGVVTLCQSIRLLLTDAESRFTLKYQEV